MLNKFSRIKKNSLGYWEIINKPTETELQEYYDQKYRVEAQRKENHKYSNEELKYIQSRISLLWSILNKEVASPGSILDVGCGDGYSIDFYRKLGWRVRGFDFSRAGIDNKNPECSNAIIVGDIYKLIKQEIITKNRYDIIFLQNVLEHVIDPIQLLGSLRSIVDPGGALFITVPNDFSDVQTYAFENGYVDTKYWIEPPDHLNYFSFDSLINIGTATGWSNVDVFSDFPIDWFLYHPGSNYVKETSFGKSAHNARMTIENLINLRPIEDVKKFWSALAKIGMGRDLTGLFKPSF